MADENEYKIPNGYYIAIKSRTAGSMDSNFTQSTIDSENGFCNVYVFRTLDPKHFTEAGRLEHMISIGNFNIHGTKKMTTEEFLREVRKGIDELINMGK